jgi:hypothetical protein
MDNIIAFGLDVSSNQMKQINTINNTLLAYNMVGGSYNVYIAGGTALDPTNYFNYGAYNSFTVPVAGNYVINVNATAWSTTPSLLQIDIWINDAYTNNSLKVITNETYSHKELVPLSFKYRLKQGTNYLAFKVVSGTIADLNDYATFSWMYAPS